MKFSRCIITVNIFPSNEATLIPKTVSFFCVTKEDSHIPSRMLYSLDAVTKTLKLNIFSKFLLKAHFFFLIIVIKKSKKKRGDQKQEAHHFVQIQNRKNYDSGNSTELPVQNYPPVNEQAFYWYAMVPCFLVLCSEQNPKVLMHWWKLMGVGGEENMPLACHQQTSLTMLQKPSDRDCCSISLKVFLNSRKFA